MRKWIVLSIILALILLFIFILFAEKKDVAELASLGEDRFLSNSSSAYINDIVSDNIDDITCQFTFSYDYGQDYDRDTKTLTLKCEVSNFTSEAIHQYYSKQSSDGKEKALFDELHQIYVRTITPREYHYEIDGIGTVIVLVRNCDSGITISTLTGVEFRYDVQESHRVMIDGVCIYEHHPDHISINSGNTTQTDINLDISTARHTDAEAWSCATDIVKSKLKSPSTADFCSFAECTVVHEGNGHYKVTGWIDAQNSLGAVIREYFTVTYIATENDYRDGQISFS